MTPPVLSSDDLRLLGMFTQPGAIRWDPTALEWTFGHPMFSLSTQLLARLDNLLLDHLIEPVPDDNPLWDMTLTDAGRTALNEGATR
ncbi:hypothetical protein ACWKSP_22335 [Micromonosporaceae bacterium Da 78-11]